ncbi:hypothetical protein GGR57DRAFT_506180 [Xylariaceae sp. FL1272]|nr:hypothetical protein GGR57DRAFT_506180 [Xylariaceae sp. FL1272]
MPLYFFNYQITVPIKPEDRHKQPWAAVSSNTATERTAEKDAMISRRWTEVIMGEIKPKFTHAGHIVDDQKGLGSSVRRSLRNECFDERVACYNRDSWGANRGEYIALELTSKSYTWKDAVYPYPTRRARNSHDWEKDLPRIWSLLNNHISLDRDHWVPCDTRFHFSFTPSHRPWTRTPVIEARLVAIAAILFQPALDDFMPMLSEIASATHIVDVRQIWKELQLKGSVRAIQDLVCHNHGAPEQYESNYTFNFCGFDSTTIEFRQFYPILNASVLSDFTLFICNFIEKVTSIDIHKLDEVAETPGVLSEDEGRTMMAHLYGLTKRPESVEDLSSLLGGMNPKLPDGFFDKMISHRDQFVAFMADRLKLEDGMLIPDLVSELDEW